ncbi:MAG: alpha/beta fold hydrolase [Elusimicrobiota bacterium]|nr:alpha/beta fold hydrolase [Elusimicrobiota bacterium]
MKARAGTEIFRVKGQKMLVHYHRPDGPEGRRFPAVLFLHGFPGSEKSVDIQRALMAQGIASVAPSFLGAWGSGGKYRFTTLPAQAAAALSAARKLPFVNPRRVALFGFSMGAWTALNAAARDPKLRAVVAVAPVGGAEMIGPDTLDFIKRLSRPLNTLAPKALAADFKKAVTAYDSARAASRIKVPLLLIHGDADQTIPAQVSRRIARCAGKKARLVIERGASHDFLDRRDRLARLCAGFLKKSLLSAVAAALLLGARPARAQAFGEAGFAAALRAGLIEAGRLARSQRPVATADAKTPEQVRRAVDARLAGRVPAAVVDAFFADPRLRVIDGIADRFGKPAEGLPYDEYRKLFINPQSLAAGARFLAAERASLSAAETRFGVDAYLLASHAGVETRFGAYTGKMPIGAALWTISLKVPRRSDWAARELAELLIFAAESGDDAHAWLGSYAGAFGLMQFMPSSANAYAVDADGDGRRFLFAWPDALGSAANYLARHGYRAGEPFTPGSAIGRAVYAYNHSENYVRVVLELRAELKKLP